ncbi:Zinc finger protein 512 [Vulpes lagopus]
MKMRRVKAAAASRVEGSGGISTKGKRKPRQEEDEDYQEFPQKKHKLYAGSLEEQWYLEIVDKGSVSCPTCQAVGRKTIEGLKKHMETCKQEMFTCHHCGKQLRSLAGMKYHVMANHNSLKAAGDEIDEPSERERLRTVLKRLGKLRCMREISFFPESGQSECLKEMSPEPKSGGRVQRRSAKIAVCHLQELASAELAKEWPKRKVLQDLVPDDRKLKYTRPGLPTFGQEVLHKWKSDIKKYHRIQCPNQDWFVLNPTTTKSFEKLMKIKQRQQEEEKQRQQHRSRRSLRRLQQPGIQLPEAELSLRVGKDQRKNNKELLVSTSFKEPEQEPVPAQFQKVKPPKTHHKRGRK